jgi:hypothetical protein
VAAYETEEARCERVQPSLPEYFGNAGEHLSQYCTVFHGFHPEVDDPLEEETDKVAVMVAGHGMDHGHTMCYL